jgi:MHS family proline/betaine transporter-like MFS transporter
MTSSTAAVVPAPRAGMTKVIVATAIGNALEWYDILIYGYFALAISKAFFPAQDASVSLLLGLGTFAISYLARPLGAMVLGVYADRHGRRASMLVSLLLMVVGTTMIAFMPAYATIGVAAPIGILAARLMQGFSAGGEFGSSTAYLVSQAPDRRGFASSWQGSSQGLSGLFASGFGVLITSQFAPADVQAYAWRLPFVFGILIGPVGLYIRRHLAETSPPASGSSRSPLATLFAEQKTQLLLAIGCVAVSTSINYFLVYAPTFAVQHLGLPQAVGYTATLIAALALVIVAPISGDLSDRIGRTRIMILSAGFLLVSIYPSFVILTNYPTAASIIMIFLVLAVVKAFYFGVYPAFMSELFPDETRATGLALSYNIAVPAFGGFGPLVMEWLTQTLATPMAPSLWLTAVAILSFASILIARRLFNIR